MHEIGVGVGVGVALLAWRGFIRGGGNTRWLVNGHVGPRDFCICGRIIATIKREAVDPTGHAQETGDTDSGRGKATAAAAK